MDEPISPLTATLWRDPYRREAEARVLAITSDGGVVVDASVFYPAGGGQPGDSGSLEWEGGRIAVADTRKHGQDGVVLIPEPGDSVLPPPGAMLLQRLDWERRHLHMRVHTALHLLSVVIPLPVTGGQIGAGRGRLDFDMPEAPGDRQELEARLNAIMARDLPVDETWISSAELARQPELVKTVAVKPPAGAGPVRLVRIGHGADQVDLQPCGGTHVQGTREIGPLEVVRIENKGRRNRRVTVQLAP